jgi:hypothetical protein
MGVKVILKSGQEIVNTSPKVTVKHIRDAMSLSPGSAVNFGEDGENGFILCSEIAAVFKYDSGEKQ